VLGASIGPGIIVPLVLLVVVVPAVLLWARRRLRETDDAVVMPTGSRLTSSALLSLGPPWRVVPEIATDALGGIDQVLVGPPGVFAVTTTMAPRTRLDPARANARAADAAISRARLDDALVAAGSPPTSSVHVHWGRTADPDAGTAAAPDAGWSVDSPGVVHVDGRRLLDWVASLDGTVVVDPGRVDAAWAAAATAIGRPDPRR
jgi:hypothetical protein